MTMPLTMTGHDRTYRPPRALREHVGTEVTAWDLFRLEADEQAGAWAHSTLSALVSSVEAETTGVLGCTECLDTGFYGVPDIEDPDLLIGLGRRVGDGRYEFLTATGAWVDGSCDRALEVLDLDTAAELGAALVAGGAGLQRLYGQPLAFLPPADCTATEAFGDVISASAADTPQAVFAGGTYALVHEQDQGAVLDLLQITAGGPTRRWAGGQWIEAAGEQLPPTSDLPLVRLRSAQLADVMRQVLAAGLPKQQKCEYCTEQATQRIIHSEGMAYIPICDKHLYEGKDAAAHCTPDGSPDPSNIDAIRPIAATGAPNAIVADAPLTVSPDPRAEKLRRYWSSGRGAAKIRWMTPGDWKRCYRHLRKYMGPRAKGYCQNLHKRNTGVWTGSRFNVGGNGRGGLFSSAAPEAALLAALRDGRVSGDTEGKDAMPDTLTDGVYTETIDPDPLLQALAASAIPVAAPDDWFEDPKLDRPTTLTVTDEGRVFGHIAPWGVAHIGMAGSVTAPRNRTGQYAYFRTGQHVTASGKSVRVGQLTLNGGHAPMDANVASVVKHYDDTNSAVADVAVGEDKHGIWAAGVLRPGVTAEQVRIMRASPPSGDWRRINGELEMVAACHVNVQGFPIAASAYFAGGSVEALVAAGARQMAELMTIQRADSALVDRLAQLESLVASLAAPPAPAEASAAPDDAPVDPAPPPAETAPAAEGEDNPAAAGTQEPEFTDEELAKADKIARARAAIVDAKREALRKRVEGSAVSAAAPPTAAERQSKSTIKGTDSFPIGNVADLKKAIQAFGRAGDKDAAKKHIISQAYKLKRPDLIPAGWRSSK